MKIQSRLLGCLLILLLQLPGAILGQQEPADGAAKPLFSSTERLDVRLSYSNRDLIRDTNDSTYLNTMLLYRVGDEAWDSVEVRIRARGNWRKANCFLAPVKVRIKKAAARGTLFEGIKELKFVLPCAPTDDCADYVLKEYLAYKFYEMVTPFHFRTRRMRLEYVDQKKRNEKAYELEAFMIEDIANVADRNRGKRLKRTVHPLQQDHLSSVQNDFFQFMIGNTDFSSAYQHNEKLIFVDGRQAIPIPYDFDMSGMVNAHYAVVSSVQGDNLDIEKVTQRLFRGFKRDPQVFDAVRRQYLDLKPRVMAYLDSMAEDFHNSRQFQNTRDFLENFFQILRDDTSYREQILVSARDQ
ncbi:hypothetical protein [Robiginitalea biformata]|uniref:Uncharacterized protein n=1 Tax=Robiginitalea biformata (strain ATCC BAA-864 / DSM 15991 / KCTC 12146 / HTCC2501) TaxID=313596 RepID=A4CH97_ROBBH|nr:hypothetical protein [Robiginitalea biformata]EAR16305.1 hypothetical protein RB2501_05385 [Robiginitalea biformata HTCC2501]